MTIPPDTTSVVIATIGRAELVESCVRSMVAVGTPPSVEVVVVDAGGSGWVDEAKLKTIWPNSRVIKSSIRNAGVQRNMGVKQARGDIIIFLDDDCYVQPGWWPNIIKPLLDDRPQTADRRLQTADSRPLMVDEQTKCSPALCAGLSDHRSVLHQAEIEDSDHRSVLHQAECEDSDHRSVLHKENLKPSSAPNTQYPITNHYGRAAIACVAGAIWRNPSPQFTDARGGYVNWFGYPIQVTHRSEKAPREVDWPISCNMACLKQAYIEVGGMADVYGVYDEDVDLGLKWQSKGWRIVFEPRAAVYHYSVSQQRKVSTKATEFRAGRNRAILLVRNYGFSVRLLLFLGAMPFIKGWEVLSAVCRQFARSAGHAAAYVAGVVSGLVVGMRNPVKKDRARFDVQGQE